MSEPETRTDGKTPALEMGALALLVVVFLIVSLVRLQPFSPTVQLSLSRQPAF